MYRKIRYEGVNVVTDVTEREVAEIGWEEDDLVQRIRCSFHLWTQRGRTRPYATIDTTEVSITGVKDSTMLVDQAALVL